ncbi:MAG: ATP-binding cassette domain-containing protein [Propionibacterium sp.]|nr:ATP-binding cassette domain-containing protein [Propionibacterium sp.]
MIRFESVSTKARRGQRGLHDISLTLPVGAKVALFGPAGAGKSALLGLVNRLVEPKSGALTWDEQPLRSHRRSALRAAVGWWSPPEGLFGERSVLDNIVVALQRLGWEEHLQRSRAFELLEQLGLPRSLAVRGPAELPADQQALVALARALAAGPEVVLGDDPLRDLPDEAAGMVAVTARRAQAEWGDRWLVATRNLDQAIALAERLVVLDDGRILQDGPVAEVVELPANARVAELIGPDRGVRALALLPAADLVPVRVATVRDPKSARPGAATLVVDRQAQPLGWTRGNPAPDGEVLTAGLGTSFTPATDTLRDALEAVLTSPTGLGVAVGVHGRYLGVIDADAVWQLAATRRAEVAEARAEQAYAEREAARAAAAAEAERVQPEPEETELEAGADDADADATEPDESRADEASARASDEIEAADEGAATGPEGAGAGPDSGESSKEGEPAENPESDEGAESATEPTVRAGDEPDSHSVEAADAAEGRDETGQGR